MNTSPTTFVLSKPSGRDKISPGVLEYFQARNRLHAFSLVQEEFQKSGISPTDLAARMGRGTDRISHLLSAPGNWTLDTISDLLFAISGAEVKYQTEYPLDHSPRNMTVPEWLHAINLDQTEIAHIKISGELTTETSISPLSGMVITLFGDVPSTAHHVGS